jgi:hypothetical protein
MNRLMSGGEPFDEEHSLAGLQDNQSTKPVDKFVDGIPLRHVKPSDSLAFQRIAQESGIGNSLIFLGILSLDYLKRLTVTAVKHPYLNAWKSWPAALDFHADPIRWRRCSDRRRSSLPSPSVPKF